MGLSCLWFIQLLELVHLGFRPVWGTFQPLFPLVFFYPYPLSFSFQDSNFVLLEFLSPGPWLERAVLCCGFLVCICWHFQTARFFSSKIGIYKVKRKPRELTMLLGPDEKQRLTDLSICQTCKPYLDPNQENYKIK